jgi:hypothetical protein
MTWVVKAVWRGDDEAEIKTKTEMHLSRFGRRNLTTRT